MMTAKGKKEGRLGHMTLEEKTDELLRGWYFFELIEAARSTDPELDPTRDPLMSATHLVLSAAALWVTFYERQVREDWKLPLLQSRPAALAYRAVAATVDELVRRGTPLPEAALVALEFTAARLLKMAPAADSLTGPIPWDALTTSK